MVDVKIFISIFTFLMVVIIGLSFMLKKLLDENFKYEVDVIDLKRRNRILERTFKKQKENNSLHSDYETVSLLALLSRKTSTSMIKSRLDEYNQGDNDHFNVYIQFLKGEDVIHYKWKIEMKYWDLFEKANTTRLSPNEHCIYGNTSKLLELI